LVVDPQYVGVRRANIAVKLFFEDFQPMWSRYLNVMDRRRDRKTTCRRPSNTALCVSSRVKKFNFKSMIEAGCGTTG